MFSFPRALRWLFGAAGFLSGILLAVAAAVARVMIAPSRQRLWTTPGARGIAFEEVQFPAADGLRVSGWFVPAPQAHDRTPATIAIVHGWQWNRLGYSGGSLLANFTGSEPVDLSELIQNCYQQGYNVLAFDLRNHGLSAAARPVTFGRGEAKDLLGALAYLESRDDVDSTRIGVYGFSIGANAALFALSQTDKIRAAVLVQPMTPAVFARRAAGDLFGVFGSLINTLSNAIYQVVGGTRLAAISPAYAARGGGRVPALFLQGTGDEWGSVEDVSAMSEMTPGTQQLLFVNTRNRSGGYEYVLRHPGVANCFFESYLSTQPIASR